MLYRAFALLNYLLNVVDTLPKVKQNIIATKYNSLYRYLYTCINFKIFYHRQSLKTIYFLLLYSAD